QRRDGRPEQSHALEMVLPVLDARVEDGTEQVVLGHLCVEGANEALDHGVVDSGPGDDVGHQRRPPRWVVHARSPAWLTGIWNISLAQSGSGSNLWAFVPSGQNEHGSGFSGPIRRQILIANKS